MIESMTYFYFSGKEVFSYNDKISISYPCETGFVAFVKADDLLKVLGKLDTDDISLNLNGETLTLKSGKFKLDFATIQDEDIVKRIATVQASLKEAKPKELPDNFIDCISLCHHVASSEDSDQTLNCLYIDGQDMVATDNKRIAHSVLSYVMEKMLIRASEMKSLLVIDPKYYIATKNWIHFVGANKCIFSIRSTKGEYPDMLKFMDFNGVKVTLPESILQGVDLASIFTDNEDPTVKITIKNGECMVFAGKSDRGKADFKEQIRYTGKEISFAVSSELLMDMLHHSTTITIDDSRARLDNDGFRMVTSLIGV